MLVDSLYDGQGRLFLHVAAWSTDASAVLLLGFPSTSLPNASNISQ
jgi:hypothetical protein